MKGKSWKKQIKVGFIVLSDIWQSAIKAGVKREWFKTNGKGLVFGQDSHTAAKALGAADYPPPLPLHPLYQSRSTLLPHVTLWF